MALTVSLSPAYAGSWMFHVDGSCSATGGDGNSGPAWTAPADSKNGTTLGGSSYVYGVGGGTGLTASVNAPLNATVTATWTHDPGQTDATDPAPTSVMVTETSSASAVQGLVGYQILSARRTMVLATHRTPLAWRQAPRIM